MFVIIIWWMQQRYLLSEIRESDMTEHLLFGNVCSVKLRIVLNKIYTIVQVKYLRNFVSHKV